MGTVPLPEHEIQAHLQEYHAISNAISESIKRIDLIRGLYLTALLGLVALLLSPQAPALQSRLQHARQDQFVLNLFLLIPIINATLLIHLTSFMHFILAGAKYNTYLLGKRLTDLIGHSVLGFDLWESRVGDKGAWLFTRGVVGVLNFAVATLVSVVILAQFKDAGRFKQGPVSGLLYCAGIISVALSLTVGLVYNLTARQFAHGTAADRGPHVSKWYGLTVPFSAALYAALQLVP
jgi:hypothetical protein